jgi:pentapeptide MXKDX repeat protein
MIVRSRLLLPVAAVALAVAFAVPAAFADDMSKDSMSKDSGMKKNSMSCRSGIGAIKAKSTFKPG